MSTDDEDECPVGDDEREDWIEYLRKELRACPAYAAHAALLEECVGIASRWRDRFHDRKALWTRIRHGSRLSKELAEQVPVMARCIAEVNSFQLPADGQRIVILDLCSGFGYLAMFLSELLPPSKVEKIVLVDVPPAAPEPGAAPEPSAAPKQTRHGPWP